MTEIEQQAKADLERIAAEAHSDIERITARAQNDIRLSLLLLNLGVLGARAGE
jgi:F0F1-type ATP synthase membrane subunit b/b'